MHSDLFQRSRPLLDRLSAANHAAADRYPGNRGARQPIHTVYGGAHLFRSTTARKLGELAERAFALHAAKPQDLASVIGIHDQEIAANVHAKVAEKLASEPVEDFRIDFEDGFGTRSSEEEDRVACEAAQQLAVAEQDGTRPPFIGIRIKSLEDSTAERSIRTLDLFLRVLVERCGGKLPTNFVVTLPKVSIPEQVSALVELFTVLENELNLAENSLRLEIMIELTRTLFDGSGRSMLPQLIDAAQGRCTGAHFGTYDYTASCSILAAHQTMGHRASDFALQLMKIGFADTGIALSDGATNIMPIGERETVHEAWKLASRNIRQSLVNGFFQGWDLHPAQLPIRFATTYAFFLESLAPAAERLRNFLDQAAQATRVGNVFDDAATGQGLLNVFLRGISCGAFAADEVANATGLTERELQLRSFAAILNQRQ